MHVIVYDAHNPQLQEFKSWDAQLDSTMHCDIVVMVAVIHTFQQVMYNHKMHPMTMNCN